MFPQKSTYPPIGDSSNLPPLVRDQWLSQSAYQNIDSDKVDWAALAQQWIHMKESCNTAPDMNIIPNAPPPPRISNTTTHLDFEEKGEAPMEVEHEEEQHSSTNVFSPNSWSHQHESNRHQMHSKQWNNKSNLNV